MPAGDEPDNVGVVGNLDQQRGDEALVGLGGVVVQLRQMSAHTAFQGGGQFGKRGGPVGGLAEGGKESGGVPDGGQALAANVADEEASGPSGSVGGVQVAADRGVRRGGLV